MDIAVRPIDNSTAARILDEGATDIPFIRHRPIEHARPTGDFVDPQARKLYREISKCPAHSVAGEAARVRKKAGGEFVHPLALVGLGGRRGKHDSYDSAVDRRTERSDVLLVIPTLGQRIDYLRQTLASIRSQEVPADIVVVTPRSAVDARQLAEEFGAVILDDPGSLPKAINAGIDTFIDDYRFVNWLNDDDLLTPGSLAATTNALKVHSGAAVTFGACRYIDSAGSELWVSRAGRWAPRVLSWGPDLIPQPGMLVRADFWKAVGGLDTSYRLAFDLDLLLKLKKLGPLIDSGAVVSCFRWHADSLTVDDRATNIAESERAKRAALGPRARRWAWMWEPPVRFATKMAASEVQRRARRISGATTLR